SCRASRAQERNMTTTLYGLKNCDTCRKARKWLDRFNVPHEFIDYRDDKPTPEMLVEWARQAGGFESLVNKSSTTWRQLPDHVKPAPPAAEGRRLLREYPQRVRRLVVATECGFMSQGFSNSGFKMRFTSRWAGCWPAVGAKVLARYACIRQ